MAFKGLMPLEGPVEQRPTKTKSSGRKVRFDKTDAIKFPVVPRLEEQLIYYFKYYKNVKKYDIKGIAEFCTFLLRFALRNPDIIDEDIEYVPLTKYKRVYPNQIELEKIDGLNGYTTTWRLNKGAATHRLVLSSLYYLLGGGEIEYVEALPLKPSK